jgi:plasmid stabilization system protein ParE
VFELLSAYPNAGALCEDPDLSEVRRILLPATKHYLYYQLHEGEQRIEVLAVWSTHRGDRPVI